MNIFGIGKNQNEWRETLYKKFYNSPHNAWIAEDPMVKRCFDYFLESIPESYKSFFSKNNLIFLRASGKLSCTLSQIPHHNIILVYPDLYQIMHSGAWTQSCAVIAHEVGHVYYGHGLKSIDPLDAQIEADHFGYTLGFGEDLQNFLLDYEHSIECKVRISRLTQKIIAKRLA